MEVDLLIITTKTLRQCQESLSLPRVSLPLSIGQTNSLGHFYSSSLPLSPSRKFLFLSKVLLVANLRGLCSRYP